MLGVYQNRINSVNTIKHWWNKNSNASSAINSLNLQNDIGITMDVINATLAKGCRIDTLNHETLKAALPQVMNLLSSKHEAHLMAGLQTSLNLLRHFAPGIIELKNAPINPRAVDLAREERIKKVEEIIDKFEKIAQAPSF